MAAQQTASTCKNKYETTDTLFNNSVLSMYNKQTAQNSTTFILSLK